MSNAHASKLGFVIALLMASGALAQDYPAKPIRIIHPYVAGGPTEILMRAIGEPMSKALGQPFVIESKPGAAGNLGAEQVARAAPDGYTLLVTVNFTLASNPHLYAKLAFDPLKDFTPVIALAGYESALIVNPSLPARNMKELIAHLKANPGKYNYPSSGKASPGHVLGALFGLKLGLDIVHVPYKGNAPAVQSVMAGETAFMLTPTTVATPLVKAGKLRMLAIFHSDRNADFPDVPTLESQGITGFTQQDVPVWYGIVAPAGTPAAIVARLNAEANRVLRDKDLASSLHARGYVPFGGTPAEFGELIRRSHDAWGKVIRATGIKED